MSFSLALALSILGSLLRIGVFSALALVFSLFFLRLLIAVRAFALRQKKKKEKKEGGRYTVGLFHPYCNSGGGGERVLWRIIHELYAMDEHVHCVIYSGDIDATMQEIYSKAASRFNLPPLPRPVEIVYLHSRWLVEPVYYPRFTMLGQSLGSMCLAFEACWRLTPDLFFDSTGFAFAGVVAKSFFGARVACYTHYPTISTDMLNKIRERRPDFNNQGDISVSSVKSGFKLIYYQIFAILYRLAGYFPEVVMANSSWTYGHLRSLWPYPDRLSIVFPPCDTASLQLLPLDGAQDGTAENGGGGGGKRGVISGRQPWIVSVGQFRAEKDHSLQVRAFAGLLTVMRERQGQQGLKERAKPPAAAKKGKQVEETKKEKEEEGVSVADLRLVLIGGVRGAEDEARVNELKQLAASLGIASQVDFWTNVPFSQLQDGLAQATVGIHSMWNEHFGIGVVEYMASGCVCLAHNSGGPRMDIVIPWSVRDSEAAKEAEKTEKEEARGGAGSTKKRRSSSQKRGGKKEEGVVGQQAAVKEATGLLAATVAEYTEALLRVFDSTHPQFLDRTASLKMRSLARLRASGFSDAAFGVSFAQCMRPLLADLNKGRITGTAEQHKKKKK